MDKRPVSVRIFHPEPGPSAGPIEHWVSTARAGLAERHRAAFLAAGATDAAILRGPPDDTPFGTRLREIVRADQPAGLVVLGSGAIPLASSRDYRDLVAAAGVEEREALANNRYSADVVAIARAEALASLPDLPGDNALPRWLAEVAGFTVHDLRRRWRLALDIDGPLELVLLGRRGAAGVDLEPVIARMEAVRSVAADRRAELTVAGRVSVRTLGWLESGIAARVRAIVEERGLRAATRLAQEPVTDPIGPRRLRPPASLVGALIERDGPAALGRELARLGEAAIVDSRVLLAHRFGVDEAAWPRPEDRFASDLLLAGWIAHPWLRALTQAAIDAPIPVLLGGHSLVDPGLRLLLRRPSPASSRWS